MPTRKRLSLKGQAIAFITTTINNWIPIFEDKKCAAAILDQLKETTAHFNLSLIAYVIMLSHIHLLIGFIKIEEMSSVMRSFKGLSSKRLRPLIQPEIASNFYFAGHFRLWKPRFDDVIIESETQFRIKIDYIHHNPVKAGLSDAATDFVYSSARDWLTNEKGKLLIDKNWNWQK